MNISPHPDYPIQNPPYAPSIGRKLQPTFSHTPTTISNITPLRPRPPGDPILLLIILDVLSAVNYRLTRYISSQCIILEKSRSSGKGGKCNISDLPRRNETISS